MPRFEPITDYRLEVIEDMTPNTVLSNITEEVNVVPWNASHSSKTIYLMLNNGLILAVIFDGEYYYLNKNTLKRVILITEKKYYDATELRFYNKKSKGALKILDTGVSNIDELETYLIATKLKKFLDEN